MTWSLFCKNSQNVNVVTARAKELLKLSLQEIKYCCSGLCKQLRMVEVVFEFQNCRGSLCTNLQSSNALCKKFTSSQVIFARKVLTNM